MIKFRFFLAQLLLLTSLLLPWTTTGAIEAFEQAGYISDIGYEKFTVNRKTYVLAPKVKIERSDPSNTTRFKFSDFKKGDEIYFKGTTLSGVNYVDIIVYQEPGPS